MSCSSDRPPTRPPRRRPAGGALAPLALFFAAGCSDGALDPRSDEAEGIAAAWWLMLALGTATFAFVLAVLAWALVRRPAGDADERGGEGHDPGAPEPRGLILGAGIVLPAAVVALLIGVTVWLGASMRADAGEDAVSVHIEGRQFWWEVEYPDHGVVTANEVHVPVGTPVTLELTSPDVIHSFWVPQVHGKIDLIPGRTTDLRFEVDEPGEYRGQCAEFCGIAHANMRLLVVAQDPDEFERWIEAQRRPAPVPETGSQLEGRQIFLGSACVYCHTVEGTNASSRFGPDLTHLASRRTLGAGVLPNTRGNLAGWILDPQHQKPGNAMPATRLTGEEVNALLDYLGTLR